MYVVSLPTSCEAFDSVFEQRGGRIRVQQQHARVHPRLLVPKSARSKEEELFVHTKSERVRCRFAHVCPLYPAVSPPGESPNSRSLRTDERIA